ncbi:MAG: exodeoxyribonuclease VII small subunit [Zetaproteobacteria bacterium]|nr:exodeoxyribonuclease VII small subunit [Zetaproteobacteria bacterium]
MTPENIESLNFEASLKQLESLVSKLESNQLPLEESIAVFEQSILLTRRCNALLDNADDRLQNSISLAEGE